MKTAIFTFITGLLVGAVASGGEAPKDLTFTRIWSKISEKSDELKASQFQQEAAEIRKRRLARHWWPKLHIDSSAFNTDDPTVNFINILGEHQVTTQDFNPTVLNVPGAHSFAQTTVGADFAIYDGGQSGAALSAQKKVVEAQSFMTQETRLQQYTEAARIYGRMMILSNERQTLDRLEAKIEKTISKYRLGTKANPVGFSGLLALKNAKAKVVATEAQVAVEIHGDEKALELMSGENFVDAPALAQSNILLFTSVYAPTAIRDVSFAAKAQLAASEAAERRIKSEKARYLPHLGLFAQNTYYTGDRGNASGYTAGGYLRWNFDATDFGAAEEAKLEAAAADSRAQAVELNDRIRADAAAPAVESNEKIIRLLQQNEKRLSDQWQVSLQLFRAGSVSANQLAGVVSNSVDLAQASAKAQKSYLASRLELLSRSNFDPLPERIAQLK